MGCYTLQSTVAASLKKGESYLEDDVMQNFAGTCKMHKPLTVYATEYRFVGKILHKRSPN